jgi:surface-anchored protein
LKPHTKLLVLLLVAAIGIAFGAIGRADTASASTTNVTSPITLSGNSAPQTIVAPTLFHCDTCAPDDLFSCGGCEITVGVQFSVATSVSWTAPSPIDTSWDSEQIRQGTLVDLTDKTTPGSGTVAIKYSLPYIAGLFGRGGDFPPGPNWTASGDTTSGTLEKSTSTACTPPLTGAPNTTCHAHDEVHLIEFCCFIGFGVDTNLVIDHDFVIGPSGIVAHRVINVSGGSIPATDLTFTNPIPATVHDTFTIPCAAPVSSTVGYNLSNVHYTPASVKVQGSVGLKITFEIPLLPDVDDTFTLASGDVFNGTLTMNGSPNPSFSLGPVLADNVPPTISSAGGPYSGNEGSPIVFTATATDNCASSLAYRWDFSDGGVAFGNNASHVFVDNGTYSGQVTVTDAAGNSSVKAFSVTVNNVAPTVSGGPPKQTDWGLPVAFHANGLDAGAIDQLSLTYTWNFNDPNDPIGAAGQDVSHVFSKPGVYNVVVTVKDKDGATNTGTVTVTVNVTQRDTTLSYTGALSSLPSKNVTLSASFVDEYGAAVVGRLVTFTLGTGLSQQTATALTDASGVASTSLLVKQKQGTFTLTTTASGDALYNAPAAVSSTYTVGK